MGGLRIVGSDPFDAGLCHGSPAAAACTVLGTVMELLRCRLPGGLRSLYAGYEARRFFKEALYSAGYLTET